MLPSGSVQMIFALHDAPILCMPSSSSRDSLAWSGGIVHGPQWTYYRSGPKPTGTIVGVSFRPGAAGNILGLPVTELTDRHVPADALWGARASELREKLLAAPDPSAAFRVMEGELERPTPSPFADASRHRSSPRVPNRRMGIFERRGDPEADRVQFAPLHRVVSRRSRLDAEALLSGQAIHHRFAGPCQRRLEEPRRSRGLGRLLRPSASDAGISRVLGHHPYSISASRFNQHSASSHSRHVP